MEKILTIAAVALLSIAASAQQANKWYTNRVDADALIGNGAYETYSLVTEKYDGIIYRSDKDNVIICCHEGIFDSHGNDVSVLVGYYHSGELINKTTREWRRGQSADTIISDEVEGLLIKNWLEDGGDIRIIAPRYGREYLDIRIPHRK